MKTTFSSVDDSLSPLKGKALIWSESKASDDTLIKKIPGLIYTHLDTKVLSDLATESSLAPQLSENINNCEAVFFTSITSRANILACLNFAKKVLAPTKTLRVIFSKEKISSQRPNWKYFWRTIAARAGFDIVYYDDETLVLSISISEPRWTLKLADDSDIESIKDLFQHVFHHDLSQGLWDWKYSQGRGNAVLAYREGKLIAHYGGIYRKIIYSNQPALALQACDVMVHPSERGVFTRHGAFFTITATWAEMYGSLNFGFPNLRSMRLGEKLGIYLPANHLIEARWPANQVAKRPWSLCVDEISLKNVKLADSINRLWKTMLSDLPTSTIGVRDWSWIEHRYLNHATNSYCVYTIKKRWSTRLSGILVMRYHENDCELMDVIAPLKKVHLLINEARRLCAHKGKKSLYAWISNTYINYFNHAHADLTNLDIYIPTDAWTRTEQANNIVGTWWMTSGDTDFR